MRSCVYLIPLALGACSVPDKKVADTDAGTDTGIQPGMPGDAPDTTITSAPAEFSNTGAATFAFTSDLATATFECAIDGEMPIPCTSPHTRTLGDGSHTFSVRASDPSGAADDTPAEHLWTIDTAAPQTVLIETPPAADNSTMVRFAFDSGERNVSFDCSLDNAAYAACTSGTLFGPVGDGAHSFAVRAHDRAGNVDASPAIFAWTVDTSTPDTQLLMGPDGPDAATTAMFTFLSPDAGSGATFECKVDADAFAACSSPFSAAALTEGNHVFAVRVRDTAGNYDPTPAMRSWIVDLTPPDTMISTGPMGLVAQAGASFTFTSNEMAVTYACSLDGGAFTACTSPANFMALPQGAHTFSVRATDAAGHLDGSPAARMWSVDTVPPDIIVSSGPVQNGTSGPRIVIGYTVSDGTVTCSLDTAAFAPCATPFATNVPAGPHSVRIRSTDAAGNVATVTRSFTVMCGAADAPGAAGVLHLDDTGQMLANAVAGGPGATLGDSAMVEPADPASVPGRFGTALVFAASEGDHVSWPVALPDVGAVTLELWAKPDALASSRELAASGDGVLSVRAVPDAGGTVRLVASVGGVSAVSAPIAAGVWHHVVVSLSAPQLRLWVDGARTEVGGASDTVSLAQLRLGGSPSTAYSGALDEVWIGQTAITTDEPALARYCPL